MYAGGTATTPSTTRLGCHENEPPGTMMLLQRAVGDDPDVEANAARPGRTRNASASVTIEVRTARAGYTSDVVTVPRLQRSSTRSLGSVKPNLR